jgi:hypothetical protein
MYSLRILFFTLPLYFSHIFSGFGIVFGGVSSFERQKVYLMVILTAIALIEWIWRYPDAVVWTLRKYGLLTLILLLCPFLAIYWWGGDIDSLYWWGGMEKHHGYILYGAIIILSLILSTIPTKDKIQYLHISIWSTVIVAIVAIYQYIGWGMVSGRYPGRSISTLGNPNYLAGYLILILPLLWRIRSPERWIIGIVIILALITTGSYIGMALLGCYLLYLAICRILRYFPVLNSGLSVPLRIFLLLTFYFLLLSALYRVIDPEKLLSLTSRFVLMKESLMMLLHDPISLLIGFGPDSLMSHFSTARSALVSAYFPSYEIIDSSHNILIDIIFQYGSLPIGAIGYTLWRWWKSQKEDVQIAILLGVWFLLLNVFVVVHLMILVLLLAYAPDLSPRKTISEK